MQDTLKDRTVWLDQVQGGGVIHGVFHLRVWCLDLAPDNAIALANVR